MKTKVKKYKLAFAVFGICSLTFNICQAQMISTVAGMGMMMYGGDGGPATAAMLSGPTGNAMDGMGNLYIVDNQNNLIRMVNTAGIINTVVGTVFSGAGVAGYSGDGGQATAAELNGPVGMAFDASRNMYIADYANNVVRKVTTAGIITTVAGMGGMMAGYAGDGGQATMAMLSGPTGVAIDAMGNLYIADSGNRRIRKVNASGIITTVVGNGTQGYSGDGGQATAAELNFSYAIAIDTHNNLYIADAGINVIRMVNTMGVISTIAGNGNGGYSGDGGPATSAELRIPGSVSLDSKGNLFIADDYNNRIREVTYSTTTSIPKLSTPQLSIYPNPAQNVIYVQLQGGAKAELVEVYNITGQKMQTSSFPSPIGEGISFSYAINSSLLSDGIYFLKVQLQYGSTLVKKVEIVR